MRRIGAALVVVSSLAALAACDRSDKEAPPKGGAAHTGGGQVGPDGPDLKARPEDRVKASLPADPTWSKSTYEAVEKALASKRTAVAAGDAEFRTKHLVDGQPTFTNQLVLEDSPYLQQHAHNPVDWRPWESALQEAQRTSRPILLSIGYATCHWCHVMERESFEDLEIAAYLNAHYVAVKVDREERPDVDAIYMEAVRQMTGRGGWPMTVWLTPEGEPFFGGTYFPARAGDRPGSQGFAELLEEHAERWVSDRSSVTSRGQALAKSIRERFDVAQAEEVRSTTDAMRSAFVFYQRGYDERQGGWGRQKFPMVPRLRLLLRYARRSSDDAARQMVRTTLDAMAAGGIRDHVGGGFHRYAVDPMWRVPHFEKMLYDNAQLALLYLEAGQLYDEPRYLAIAEETVAFLSTGLGTGSGAFWSALDAESGGFEGGYYTWTPAELDAAGASDVFDLRMGRGLEPGHGALNRRPEKPLGEELRSRMEAVRAEREPPRTDTKVVAEWNGMALQALARVGWALDDPELVERARALARFLRDRMWRDGRLSRSWTAEAGASAEGTSADYVFVVAGLIALFEATAEREWLELALEIDRALDARFYDRGRSAYRRSPRSVELLADEYPIVDGATPSANSQALLNAHKLFSLTLDAAQKKRFGDLQAGVGHQLNSSPWAVPHLLIGLDFAADRPREVVVAGADPDGALVGVLREELAPSKVFVTGTGAELGAVAGRVPWAANKSKSSDGKPRAFVCYETVCELPTTDPEVFRKQLTAMQAF